MTSQMNVVQNAARLAMDHRAADPRRIRRPLHGSSAWWLAVAAAAVVALTVFVAMPV